jgi:NADH:ubiquinone reductase (H+-translocating)
MWAWFLWCVVHIFFLIGFRNRFRVMSEWVWYYLTFKAGARLIYYLDHRNPDISRSSN